MFLYEGTDIRKGAVYEYEYTKPQSKSDFNGNFEIYEAENYLEEYERKQNEPKLNLGKVNFQSSFYVDYVIASVSFGDLLRWCVVIVEFTFF